MTHCRYVLFLLLLAGCSTGPDTDPIVLSHPSPSTCSTVHLAGYLPRITRQPASALWRSSPEYVAALVYGQNYGDSSLPLEPLTRWDDNASIVIDDQIGITNIDAVSVEFTEATGRMILQGGPAVATVTVRLHDVGRTCWAGYRQNNNRIYAAEIVCGDRAIAQAAFPHELGHVLGLDHSRVPGDLMGPVPAGPRPQHLSDGERLALRMMYLERQPGNRWPDTEESCGDPSTYTLRQ